MKSTKSSCAQLETPTELVSILVGTGGVNVSFMLDWKRFTVSQVKIGLPKGFFFVSVACLMFGLR